ncbi:MAG: phosphotransferase, partial [Candidatus Omnitrophica bacterium]|nr:phosphotransferase [Candidatus Omnitrophota bacterium]
MRNKSDATRNKGTPALTLPFGNIKVRVPFIRYLPTCRWFGGKSRTIRAVSLAHALPLPGGASCLALLKVSYTRGPAELYSVPLSLVSPKKRTWPPASVVGQTEVAGRPFLIVDAALDPAFHQLVFEMLSRGQEVRSQALCFRGCPARTLAYERARRGRVLPARILSAEQSNTALVFGGKFYLKLFRRLEAGINPDAEVTRYLGEQAGFSGVPAFAGTLELSSTAGQTFVLGLLEKYVPAAQDAWGLAVQEAGRYFDLVAKHVDAGRDGAVSARFLRTVGTLARCSAGLHRALASPTKQPDFRTEACSAADLRRLAREMQREAWVVLRLLSVRASTLPTELERDARSVLERRAEILKKLAAVCLVEPGFPFIRIHGDLHLGQVLLTTKGKAVIIDLEGEPARPLRERRRKQPALRDVAGMLRSFDYAACVALRGRVP